MAEEKETSKPPDGKKTLPDPDTETLQRGQPTGDLEKRGKD